MGDILANHIDKINLSVFANDLAKFLNNFHKISTRGASELLPGEHNFFRGGSLEKYNDEFTKIMSFLENKIDIGIIKKIWGIMNGKS